ncbi:MAG: DUF1232 domain-containing protein [Polaromonas sp.]
MGIKDSVSQWARRLRRDALMLWFERRHPDTPLLAKALCVLAVAYALSPIDLIPDFIPILGYLDDALLLPALIWLAVRVLPPHVIATCRAQADQWMSARKVRPTSFLGAAFIAMVWIAVGWLFWTWYRHGG